MTEVRINGVKDRRVREKGSSIDRSSRFDESKVFGSHASSHRINGAAGPSKYREEPIVIDDDEDEVNYGSPQAESSKRRSESGRREDAEELEEAGFVDHLQAREAVRAALSKLDAEVRPATFSQQLLSRAEECVELKKQMQDVRAQIEPLQALLVSLQSERKQLESQLSSLHRTSTTSGQSKSAPSRTSTIDYQSSSFPWSSSLIPLLRKTFDIPSFRLCQEGVVNAAIDGRDIVCVMPTGGGKSLTYQLPAVIGKKGLTVVISPLLALIWDQVRAMTEIGVESVVSHRATGS